MTDLIKRRGEFIYNACRLAAIAANAPVIPDFFNNRDEAFKLQFYEVIERQCGDNRSYSPQELHGSWMQAYVDMGWEYGKKYDSEKKTHPDMVPYDDLNELERDKDAIFILITEIARQFIR